MTSGIDWATQTGDAWTRRWRETDAGLSNLGTKLQVALIEDVAGQPRKLRGSVHPIFGRMSERTWLRWAYLHTDHHLRQFGE